MPDNLGRHSEEPDTREALLLQDVDANAVELHEMYDERLHRQVHEGGDPVLLLHTLGRLQMLSHLLPDEHPGNWKNQERDRQLFLSGKVGLDWGTGRLVPIIGKRRRFGRHSGQQR